jgi:hypothetical protein
MISRSVTLVAAVRHSFVLLHTQRSGNWKKNKANKIKVQLTISRNYQVNEPS